MEWLVHFGASEDILVDAHPHIGTNKLPAIITAMRTAIMEGVEKFILTPNSPTSGLKITL